MKFWTKLLRNRRGAALFEYSLLLAGVGLVTIAAVSVFGNKVADMTAAVATVLPGAHEEDNNPIVTGQLIETDDTVEGLNGTTGIGIDVATIVNRNDTKRLGVNTGTDDGANQDLTDLVLELE
ncbi:MAG: hypothetical protein MUE73_07005 [Planctomycetes bacterium]|jgi:Flp pilus assembly pilin Flp|nr:hypothetical protein [Planctomycetota bacterium]